MDSHPISNLFLVAAVAGLLTACGPREDALTGPQQDPTVQPSAPQPAPGTGPGEESRPVDQRPMRDQRELDETGSEAEAGVDQAAVGGPAMARRVPAAVEPLLGHWTVTGHRLSPGATVNDATARQLYGRTVSFSPERVESGADHCDNPVFEATEGNIVEFLLRDYQTSPVEMQLDIGAEARIGSIEVECIGQPWTTIGSRVLILPDRTVLAPWDGAFFELSPL